MAEKYENELEIKYSEEVDVKYRRSLGQFFTPYDISIFMSEWILKNSKRGMKVLDPAAGLGIFARSLKSLNDRKEKDISIIGYEIDNKLINNLKQVYDDLELRYKIINSDFLEGSWTEKFDGIIANPPYYKHHYIKNKEQLYQKMCIEAGFKFSIQTNIYCWFLIKSMNMLADNGRLAFIVPSEFLNANYGVGIKKYLIQSGLDLHLLNISFENNVFKNAITTSIIILAHKSKQKNSFINFYNVTDISFITNLNRFLKNHPKSVKNRMDIDVSSKWRNYFNGNDNAQVIKTSIPFTTYGRFSRGIATGANEYFTLSKEDIKKLGLPSQCLLPCITKASYVREHIFSQKDFDHLSQKNKKIYLFNGERVKSDSVEHYIKLGEEKGVNQRYLTKSRKPWYSLEKRAPSKIWINVFGRDGTKFTWNDSNCVSLTCFHCFYPTELGKKYLDILFLYLNTKMAKDLINREKREYGNGLGKFEPNDINKSPALDFQLLSKKQLASLKSLQKRLLMDKNIDAKEIIQEAENVLLTIAN